MGHECEEKKRLYPAMDFGVYQLEQMGISWKSPDGWMLKNEEGYLTRLRFCPYCGEDLWEIKRPEEDVWRP